MTSLIFRLCRRQAGILRLLDGPQIGNEISDLVRPQLKYRHRVFVMPDHYSLGKRLSEALKRPITRKSGKRRCLWNAALQLTGLNGMAWRAITARKFVAPPGIAGIACLRRPAGQRQQNAQGAKCQIGAQFGSLPSFVLTRISILPHQELHPYKIRQAISLHFGHKICPVHLNGPWANPEIIGNDFVGVTRYEAVENLHLTIGKRGQA